MSLKPQNNFSHLICACLSVLLSMMIAAALASRFGSTYNSRVLIYSAALLWCIIGNVLLTVRVHKTSKPVTLKLFMLWLLFSLLWPLAFLGKKKN